MLVSNWVAKPSIQRVQTARTVEDPAGAYFDWVNDCVVGVKVARRAERVDMHLFGARVPAISLARAEEPQRYLVAGGSLVADPPGGEFTFSQLDSSGLEIALRGFTPRLPRPIYVFTHSLIHEFVMWLFKRHLELLRLEGEPK